ncbi:MAG TPA: RNA methyltransferase [Rhodocyclaceae bacterium]|jgi:tRNA/rRNA methyltransferase|nr:RNA methyltransferase [Rhodocyclaceae bacterium]
MTDPLSRIRVVLSRTSHPGNIGAAARAMKTMGLSRLYLVAPKHLPEEQAIAMASGADDVLAAATIVSSLEEALHGTVFAVAMTARRRDLSAPIVWVREAVANAVAMTGQGEVALVFGNETAGLTNQETDLCQLLAMIPANAEYSSLNLAAAVQVACYELRLAGTDVGAPPPINEAGLPATHEEVEGLVGHLEAAAIGSGFLDPAQPKRLIPRMRRLFARAALEKEEVMILRGMLAALMKPEKPKSE